MANELVKPTYEDLERRFQAYCKHDGGRVYNGKSNSICGICGWDTSKCQHRQADAWDKYCRACGELLKKGGSK